MPTAQFIDATTIRVIEDDGTRRFVPVDPGNRHYRQLLDDGTAIAPADPPPAPGYRTLRAQAYRAQLGQDAGFEETVGDVLDAIIKHLNGEPAELAQMVTTIAQIKAQYPKP